MAHRAAVARGVLRPAFPAGVEAASGCSFKGWAGWNVPPCPVSVSEPDWAVQGCAAAGHAGRRTRRQPPALAHRRRRCPCPPWPPTTWGACPPTPRSRTSSKPTRTCGSDTKVPNPPDPAPHGGLGRGGTGLGVGGKAAGLGGPPGESSAAHSHNRARQALPRPLPAPGSALPAPAGRCREPGPGSGEQGPCRVPPPSGAAPGR